jgi:hypothetical protein
MTAIRRPLRVRFHRVERCVTPERWRQIEDLYHRAQAQHLADRAAFLAQACGTDETLRREVESLLSQPASVEGVLEPRLSQWPLGL